MSAAKILWGQILAVALIILGTTWIATEWTAWRLGFQAQLGEPWFILFGWPVYYPPSFFLWWYFYDAYAPSIFVEGAVIAASGGFIAIAVAISMSVWRAREATNVDTYGSARWARTEEVKAAGLLGPDGVVLGKLGRDYLRHDGPEHVLCFAPTRSGKGVGLVIPSLLTWPGSAIVHDIKGENWQLTSGFRARHGRVLLFDPTNAKSSAYNPLLEAGGGSGKSATSRTLPTSWSTRKDRWRRGIIGRRPPMRCWSAPSCTCSTPRRTRRWRASRPFSRTHDDRLSQRSPR